MGKNIMYIVRRILLFVLPVLVIHAWGGHLAGQQNMTGQCHLVRFLELQYEQDHPAHPPIASFADVQVKLAKADGCYIAWQEGYRSLNLTLAEVFSLPDRYLHDSAVDAVAQAIVHELNRRGYYSVRVKSVIHRHDVYGLPYQPEGAVLLQLKVGGSLVKGTPPGSYDFRLALKEDGKRYRIKCIELEYIEDHATLPDLDEFMNLRVQFGRSRDGYVSKRNDLELCEQTIGKLGELDSDYFYSSALRAISQTIVGEFNRRGIGGISVAPAPGQIDQQGRDIRPPESECLKLQANISYISEIRTAGSGERFGQQQLNHPSHDHIEANSPLQPSDRAGGGQDILRSKKLTDYVHWLNRHPGRRVDVGVAAAEQPGHIAVDYVIQENRPWMAYFQTSNTGTEQTNTWRQRFGYVNYQLTSHDDILSLDYLTAGFDASHAFIGSYEAPLPGLDRVRWKILAAYSQYVASDVGFLSQDFSGNSWNAGGELSWNWFQHNDFFIDLVAGATFQSIETKNDLLAITAEESFFKPNVGLRFQRKRMIDNLYASVFLDTNLPSVAGTDKEQVSLLGRSNVDQDWLLVRWDGYTSIYLDPIFAPSAIENIDRPPVSTLDHEFYFGFRGQQTLDQSRLIPQVQQTVGGMYTARGYDESVAVGDNAMIFTLEYRYHLPRALDLRQQPDTLFGRPFKWSSQTGWDRPDWDLVLKGFVDYGVANINNKMTGEEDVDLLGAGVGMELLLWQNFNLRLDWAMALDEIEGKVDSGDHRLHLLTTLLY